MAERMGNSEVLQDLESTTVWVNRTSTTVKGGRRMSFAALVVVGDRRGRVGIGYAKAPGVPNAIEKAQKEGRKRLLKIVLQEGTIPHPVEAKYCASIVRLIPAAPGTGVVAGGTVRAVLEMAGIRDALTKVYGSSNKINLTRATFDALLMLKGRGTIADLRSVEITSSAVDEMLEKGRRYAPKHSEGEQKLKGPVNSAGQRRGGQRGGQRGRRGRGGDAGQSQAPQTQAPQTQPSAPAPAPTPAPETKA